VCFSDVIEPWANLVGEPRVGTGVEMATRAGVAIAPYPLVPEKGLPEDEGPFLAFDNAGEIGQWRVECSLGPNRRRCQAEMHDEKCRWHHHQALATITSNTGLTRDTFSEEIHSITS